MRITLETDYAIRMIDCLSLNKNRLSAVTLSETTGVPLRFAKNILQKLSGAGIVKSHHGVYGGYTLNKTPADISLYDVVEATQGPIVLGRSMLEEQESNERAGRLCAYDEFFKQLSIEMESRLRTVNFDSIKN